MGIKIKYVDGFEIRRTIMPSFHFSGKSGEYGCELIPKGEVWVEKEYRDESKQIIQYERLFQKLMKKMSYQKARAYINKFYLKKTHPLHYKIREAKREVSQWIKWLRNFSQAYHMVSQNYLRQLKTYFVNGKNIRSTMDILFVFGGHEFVYEYIPKFEIWLDARQDKRELKYTFFHELYEYQLMKKGMDYDSAHDFAIAFEKYLKRKDGVANYEFDAEENRNKILKKYPPAP